MRIFFDSEKAKEIERKIVDKFREDSQERTRVHLSDTCYCPLKVYHRLIGMIETQDDGGASIMMTGVMGQMIIQNVFPPEWAEYESSFMPSHVDVMEFIDGKGHPLEIKFTNTVISTSSEIKGGWVKQLMRYLAVHDSDYGWFLIMNLRTRKFNAWKMTMDADERATLRQDILKFEKVILEGVSIFNLDPNGNGYINGANYIL